MYILGIIDDDKEQFRLFSRRFKNLNKDIKSIFVEKCNSCEDVYNWIIDNKIECLLVDFKLLDLYQFNGAELVDYINSKIPDLPCIVLTSFKEDAEDEKLVMEPLIFEKSIMYKEKGSQEIEKFINQLTHAIEVFRNRMKKNEEEYRLLLRRKEELNSTEYERLQDLFKLLKSYRIIDNISIASIDSVVSNKIDSLILKIDKIIEE